MTVSPQLGSLQFSRHASGVVSEFRVVPSSHSSGSWISPSPQKPSLSQLEVQPSPLAVLPSSHSSLLSVISSPQNGFLHSCSCPWGRHWSGPVPFSVPLSHCSPSPDWTMSSPQNSSKQRLLQPSL